MTETKRCRCDNAFLLGMLAGVAATVVCMTVIDDAHGATSSQKLRRQIAHERSVHAAWVRGIAHQTRTARGLSVQAPVFRVYTEQVVKPPRPNGTLARQLRRERVLRRIDRRLRLDRLAAWRDTVPRVPAFFVHQAVRVASCESGLRWGIDAYHDGGLQFLPSTWRSAVRMHVRQVPYRHAYQAPPRVQIEVAYTWWRANGHSWLGRSGWPVCGKRA